MGEVYRARDARLGRDVAIKILPDLFAADADRVARFQREAQVLASLNHPGIAQLYGFETATLDDGAVVHVIAMELAEGEDLAERLKRGPLPVDEAIGIAREIAEALEAAHERGRGCGQRQRHGEDRHQATRGHAGPNHTCGRSRISR